MSNTPEYSPQDPEGDFWHNGPVVYQIYPRSFKATHGSAEGTIAGITEQLGHLKGDKDSLDIDAIWLTPFYKSPMVDGGYDISSYREVNPNLGNLEDIKTLIVEAHDRNIKIMVDFVPNHMSSDSEWYKESSASRDNSKSDWFIYRDAKPDGSLPNNWLSQFWAKDLDESGQKQQRSVWTYVPERNQYVMCTFTEAQVDLNWHNPKVREAMKDEMRFLLDLGVDGLRVDMVTHIGKHPDLLDEPLNPDYDPTRVSPDQKLLIKYRNGDPSLYNYMQEMVGVLREYDGNRFMVTEDYIVGEDPTSKYLEYYKNVDPKFSAPFCFQNFEFMMPRTASNYKKFYDNYLGNMEPDFVPTSVLGNHDQSRVATRIGHQAARAAALMELTLPGIPFVYYGEELGMENVVIPPEMVDDPYDGRDPERTPMQWSPADNAGFTNGDKTWLPLSSDYENRNVQSQLKDPHSFLSLYRRLIKLRHSHPSLRIGTYIPEVIDNETVFGYSRQQGSDRLTILINFSSKIAVTNTFKDLDKVIISSSEDTQHDNKNSETSALTLLPYEGLVITRNSTA